ncbi:hypothetical protein AS850_07550 [Frondihabitans sp. 762G35]|uniref:endolytic transglycosylase MltG n=1 Tax=Frondihabitans sp. 762G35 TaxID=1446794 RepID=UPI000D2249E0|nr:endolytic transglycosylase MltG [Frondihabitans sp. 762G35]ARC56931.1 hypothetical protein AS850_07550 [Frondihabitans sp. 762G35]
MADEPSWDDIFSGSGDSTGRARTTPEEDGASRPAAPRSGPVSRRELRERERQQERGRSVPDAAPAAGSDAPSARAEEPALAPQREPADPFPSTTTAAAPPPKPPRRKTHRGTWILAIILVVVLGGGAIGAATLWNQVAPGVQALFGAKPSDDYEGSGNGTKVQFTIASGDIGSTVAANLAKAEITKSTEAPYKILLANPSISFQPGTYSMYQHMSAQSAIDRLQETDARLVTKLVIPEGTTLKGIVSLMATATKLPTADIQKAAADYRSYGLPGNATSLEGYLFPATYELDPGKTAHEYFQEMVDTMLKRLQSAGVAPAQYEHTIIFASLIQKEAGLAADFPKVARVFQNRIDQGMLLQSDATVAYGTGSTGRVTTTDAERADASNRYNTYVHKGLPVGPISNPGDTAIEAASHPASGSWLYFVTVDLETGQTVFSTTYDEHLRAVSQFQAWLRAHPSYNK